MVLGQREVVIPGGGGVPVDLEPHSVFLPGPCEGGDGLSRDLLGLCVSTL
jgi:hypothetical protein